MAKIPEELLKLWQQRDTDGTENTEESDTASLPIMETLEIRPKQRTVGRVIDHSETPLADTLQLPPRQRQPEAIIATAALYPKVKMTPKVTLSHWQAEKKLID